MAKVCHMSSAHENTDPRIFYKQCVSLAKAGYETYLVIKGESFVKAGVHVVGVPMDNESRLYRMLYSSKVVYQKALELDANIYTFHDPELLPYGLKLKKKGKHVIFDSHEDYPTQILEKEWIPSPLRKLISGCYKKYETHVVKQLDAVLFPCTKNGKNIFDGRAKQTVIISNAVLLDPTATTAPIDSSEENTAETHKKRQGNTICCTGSLTYQRGITHLIKAAYQAGVRLILAGNYSSPEYQKELEGMPQYACVDYRGYLGREGIFQIYQESDIGMSTILNVGQYSSLDNFPTKVYEYMAVGLPVIVSDYPFMRRSVEEDGFGVCVNPQNTQAIAKAIKDILSKPQKAAAMGKKGLNAVANKYNWTIEEKKLLDLYQQLMHSCQFSKVK